MRKNFKILLAIVSMFFAFNLYAGHGELNIACGIFGIVNTKKKKQFDYTNFSLLGMLNDERGGDSCGVFIDGVVEYGVTENKLFRNFIYNSKLLPAARGSNIHVALGHCRKASVGAIDAAHAQPVLITDKSGKVKFVLVHNGTIYNYEELAKKYIPEIDIKGMTDSQVMAHIFYYKGYDCLSEYYGGAVFFIVDYRQPKTTAYFFQGKSKKYNYTTTGNDATEERPLYFVYDDKEGDLMFSSMGDPLVAIHPDRQLYVPNCNTLLKFDHKGLQSVKVYPRDKVSQTKPYTATTYSGTSYPAYGTPGYTGKPTVISSRHYGYDGYEGYSSDNWDTVDNNWKSGSSKTEEKKTEGSFYSQGSIKPVMSPDYRWTDNKDKLLHDKKYITPYGTIVKDGKDTTFEAKAIYFFMGIPLDLKYGDRYFKFLTKVCERCGYTKEELVKQHLNAIRYLSADPIYTCPAINSIVKATGLGKGSTIIYTGDHIILGKCTADDIKNGVRVDEHWIQNGGYKAFFSQDPTSNCLIPYKDILRVCRK